MVIRKLFTAVSGKVAGPPKRSELDIRNDAVGEMASLSLAQLNCVVFDTETTGLQPWKDDEIVSIGGMRIEGGQLLHDAPFSRLVNPRRDIPERSTHFHGITDDMVADKPDALVVLPAFHEFAKGCVLIAHEAPFDMRFLYMKEEHMGFQFENPVLDTHLLSAFLHERTLDHSLDGVAKRFGVKIAPEVRHTALGDAQATGEIFVHMIDKLKARGVQTLGDAIEASRQTAAMLKFQKPH